MRASIRVAEAAFLLTCLGMCVVAAAAAAALLSLNAGLIVRGTSVAGVAVGGLDRVTAEARLREQLPSLSTGHLTVQWAAFQGHIAYGDVGRDYDMAAMLDGALSIGHSGDVVADLRDQVRALIGGATVAPRARWDQAALSKRLAALAMAAQRQPIDATIVTDGTSYVVHPSTDGISIDVSASYQQASSALATLSPADTAINVDARTLPAAVGTSQAQQAVDQLERIVGRELAVIGTDLNVVIGSKTIRSWVSLEEARPGNWQTVVDRGAITRLVTSIGQALHADPVDASYHWSGGDIVVIPEQYGRDLDIAATTATIEAAIANRADGYGSTAVAATIDELPPAFTADQAPRLVMISSWTTGFVPSERNFMGNNITIPARIIDGTVVMPGAKFDFWRTVGDLSRVRGIGPGGVIKNGHTDPTGAIGGGICSVSTTLWNAALRGGLQMDERHAHDYYINRYPTGLDATVFLSSSGGQDMTWINDTSYPIKIRTVVGKSKRQCSAIRGEFGSNIYSHCITFELWSLPLDRHVSFTRPAITNVVVPGDYIEYTDTNYNGEPLLAGQTYRLEYPVVGFQSSVTRTVKDRAGNVVHRETWNSRYVSVDGLLLVGWQDGDPPVGTIEPNTDPLPPIKPAGVRLPPL